MNIIEVKNLSKCYAITNYDGQFNTLRDKLVQILKNPTQIFRDNLNIGNQEFWALKNINFSVKRGEVLGIIGANGAGKSTLLKILSRVTPPTEGEIIMHGRVASLLEVGTGFHPELTGQENIYLNGSILGMSKKEVDSKFDQIVDFAEVKKFLATPVKRYSSGMYVRLAFSVAAHMEPDILIIDEVLAVGDIEFQKKCINKIKQIVNQDARTVLFVSHSMELVQGVCSRCILFEDGQLKRNGATTEVVGSLQSSKKL